eukprot:7022961-Pyramimonas_sp.AAC.2
MILGEWSPRVWDTSEVYNPLYPTSTRENAARPQPAGGAAVQVQPATVRAEGGGPHGRQLAPPV